MSNPVFRSSDVFGERGGRAGRAGGPVAIGTAGTAVTDAATLEQMYAGPAATSVQTGRMTYDDVIVKTGGLLALVVAAAAVTWFTAPQLAFPAMLVALVLGLVNSFKRTPSPALIIAYAVAEGVFLGGLSYIVQNYADGRPGAVDVQPIVLQALLATAATFVATLALFSSGKIRVTAKATRFFVIAMVAYGLFSLINLGLMWFGGMGGWGLRSEVTVAGIPLGVIVGAVGVLLATYSLVMDFDAIKRGVERGAPARMAWTAAFGLVVTIVWLYLEMLRILAILRDR